MIRALKATGATPAEIAKTMQQALEKTGASQEEIARMMAKAMAEAGATRKIILARFDERFSQALHKKLTIYQSLKVCW